MLQDGLIQIQFDIQNTYVYIETLSSSRINLKLINPPNLQYLLYDIRDQLRSHPRLDLPQNYETDIWSYYTFVMIQAFVLMDTSFVILTIPLVDRV